DRVSICTQRPSEVAEPPDQEVSSSTFSLIQGLCSPPQLHYARICLHHACRRAAAVCCASVACAMVIARPPTPTVSGSGPRQTQVAERTPDRVFKGLLEYTI